MKFSSKAKNIATLPERKLGALRKKIGILFQSGALFDSMTVQENIAFPLRAKLASPMPIWSCADELRKRWKWSTSPVKKRDAGELEWWNAKTGSGSRGPSSAEPACILTMSRRPA